MTNELLDLFDEAKRIIDKQETLIKMQQSLINTMQQGLQGVELNELLLKKQLARENFEDKLEQNEDLSKLRAGVSLAKSGINQAQVMIEDN